MGIFYKNSVNIYKSKGKFYYVYDENAWVMAYLFGYKLIDNSKRVGFPGTALESIKYELDEQKISYAVFNINDAKYNVDKEKSVVIKDIYMINYLLSYFLDRRLLSKKYVESTLYLLTEISKMTSAWFSNMRDKENGG